MADRDNPVTRILDGKVKPATVLLLVATFFIWTAAAGHSISTVAAARQEGLQPNFLLSRNALPEGAWREVAVPEVRMGWAGPPIDLPPPAFDAGERSHRRHAVDRMREVFPDPDLRRLFIEFGLDMSQSTKPAEARRRDLAAQEYAARYTWSLLTAAPGLRETDLVRLRAVVEEAIPDPAERVALLRWAAHRRVERASLLGAGLLPDCEWTLYWILYVDWCAPGWMLETRKGELVQAFGGPDRHGRDTWELLAAWGTGLARGRHAARPDVYPAPSERAAVLAVSDLILGLAALPPPAGQSPLWWGFYLGYPDDEPVLLAVADRKARPNQSGRPSEVDWVGILFVGCCVLIAGGLVLRSIEAVTLGFIPRLISLSQNPSYRGYVEACWGRAGGLLAVNTVCLVPAVLVSRHYLSPAAALALDSTWLLLLGVGWAVFAGGLVVSAIGNLITVGFFRAGYDARRTAVDDLVAAGLSGWLLSQVVESWQVVVSMVILGLSKSVARKVVSRVSRPGDTTSPSPAPGSAA